jgi:hypothetical protein
MRGLRHPGASAWHKYSGSVESQSDIVSLLDVRLEAFDVLQKACRSMAIGLYGISTEDVQLELNLLALGASDCGWPS